MKSDEDLQVSLHRGDKVTSEFTCAYHTQNAEMSNVKSNRQSAYYDYLQSDHWTQLREKILERDNRACVVCGRNNNLQVHHKVYRPRLEDAALEDLETLCRTCHAQQHGIGPTAFEYKAHEIRLKLQYEQLPTSEEEEQLVELALFFDGRHEAEGLFRFAATIKIAKSARWESWLKKPPEIRSKLFSWSRDKFDRIASQFQLATEPPTPYRTGTP